MNNENQNIIGYDPQTGQPIYGNSNQINNNINNHQYSNENPVISEQLKKSRKTLHTDSIILMIVSIVAMITGILFLIIGTNFSINLYEESSIDLFMESLFYLIFLIIIICNKKEFKKFVGVLAIIVSCFMMFFAIFNRSLFDVIYFILGIFYMIHAIKYLNYIKGTVVVKEQQQKLKIDKLKYISLGLLIMCFVYPILNYILAFTIFADMESNILLFSPLIVVFIFAVASLVISIILLVKKRKSALIYVCLVFSILITLLTGIFVPDQIKSLISDYKYKNSEDYNLNKVEEIERYFGSYVAIMVDEERFERPTEDNKIIITKKQYEEKLKTLSIDRESLFLEYEKENYKCDGYVVITKDNKKVEEYLKEYPNSSYIPSHIEDAIEPKAYISCTGKYKYQTDGFDLNNLK